MYYIKWILKWTFLMFLIDNVFNIIIAISDIK